MLSTLPKLADRNFIVGFVVPALVAALSIIWLFFDLPGVQDLWKSVLSDKSFSDLTLVVLGIWLLAIGLQTANIFFYRMLEGYLWPIRNCAWLANRQSRARDRLEQVSQRLNDEWQRVFDLGVELAPDERRQLYRAKVALASRFPPQAHLLPTGFGNAIRAFETYPSEVFGIDGVYGWIRLQGVIPKEYGLLLDAARSEIDMFVNLVWIALMIAGLSAGRLIANCDFSALMMTGSTASVLQAFLFEVRIRHIVICLGALSFAAIFYKIAKLRVPAWGDLVKGAFDLYIEALAIQLGAPKRPSAASKRLFWKKISLSMIFRRPR